MNVYPRGVVLEKWGNYWRYSMFTMYFNPRFPESCTVLTRYVRF